MSQTFHCSNFLTLLKYGKTAVCGDFFNLRIKKIFELIKDENFILIYENRLKLAV